MRHAAYLSYRAKSLDKDIWVGSQTGATNASYGKHRVQKTWQQKIRATNSTACVWMDVLCVGKSVPSFTNQASLHFHSPYRSMCTAWQSSSFPRRGNLIMHPDLQGCGELLVDSQIWQLSQSSSPSPTSCNWRSASSLGNGDRRMAVCY